ncbi:MAG: DUF5686 family protein [Ignavibacteriales bacterium]|nr:DUF5686 family protein [Ignavibacteriales bacterium]
MNTLSRISMICMCAVFILAATEAQTTKKENAENDKHESLGQRIGSIVEGVIDKLEKEFSGRSDETGLRKDSSKKLHGQPSQGDMFTKVNEDSNVTYQGNTVIQRGDTLNTNVIVKGGDLTIYGHVNGDVLVIGGDVYLRDGAYVGGNIKVINGEVNKDDDAIVMGYIDKGSSKKEKAYREEEKNFRRSSTKLNANWVSETTNLDNFIFRYNRVEGLFLGVGSEKRYYWDNQRSYSLYGSAGYGFKSHHWRGNLGLSRQFAFDDGQLIEIEAEAHSLTDTKDDWLIGVQENTAAALLIHEDYRDYYRRDGYGINLGYATQREYITGQLKVGYLADEYRSMENQTEWSFFGGSKQFRPNPAIDDGKMGSIFTSAGLSTVTSTIYGPEGWSILATAEVADKNLGGVYTFNRYVADVRRYQPLGRYDNLNIRVRVGSSEGALPLQKTFEIGGLGTVQGFPFKGEMGNRMVLMNAELIVNGDFLGDLSFWPSWLMRGINLLVLTDAGLVRTVDNGALWTNGFDGIKISDFRHDVGAGVASRSGAFRLAFVWRTDRSEPARFIFRFSRPF